MKIIKVINNNTVCVKDDRGKELIVAGKGIGYAKKYGDEVEPSQIQKTYLIADSHLQKKMIDLLSNIPDEYIMVTNDMVSYIKESLKCTLNEALLVTLSDHIYFAIERKKQGIELTNPLIQSIEMCYPQELELGKYCVEQIAQRLDTVLHPDEAGFIAMHIINARLDTHMSQVYGIAKMINGCSEIVEHYYSGRINHTSRAYENFMRHLKELVQRIHKDEVLPDVLSKDEEFTESIKRSFKKHYKCAKCIQEYILKTYAKSISDDELLTLTLHLKRISTIN